MVNFCSSLVIKHINPLWVTQLPDRPVANITSCLKLFDIVELYLAVVMNRLIKHINFTLLKKLELT